MPTTTIEPALSAPSRISWRLPSPTRNPRTNRSDCLGPAVRTTARSHAAVPTDPGGLHVIKRSAERERRSWRSILRRDPCSYCGDLGGTVEHIVPRYRNGADTIDNLAGACRICNRLRRTRLLLLFLVQHHASRRDVLAEKTVRKPLASRDLRTRGWGPPTI